MSGFTYEGDLVYDTREIRVQAIHVEGCDPSLAGVSVYLVNPDGQWHLFATWDVGPFEPQSSTDEITNRLVRLIKQILG
jgi:hypothetical protein